MNDYPNIDALIQGRVSGSPNEWPQLRHEVAAMMKQVDAQRGEIAILQAELERSRIRNASLNEACIQYRVDREAMMKQIITQKEQIDAQRNDIQKLVESDTYLNGRNEVLQSVNFKQKKQINVQKARIDLLVCECKQLRKKLTSSVLNKELNELKELVVNLTEQRNCLHEVIANKNGWIKQLRHQRNCLKKYFGSPCDEG